MQINTRKKDVIWNYLGIFFSLGSQVIWLPVLIHYLPPDILGLWYVFVSIGSMVELLDSGFTPTLSHSMSYAWSGARDLKKQGVVFSEDRSGTNYPLVYGILSTCRTLYFGIACAATLVMLFAGTIYVQRIAADYLSWQVYATWGLYIASTFINLYIGYYAVVLVGIGDIFHKNRAQIFSKSVFLLLGTAGLVCGFGILSLGVAYFTSGFVLRFLCKRYLIKAHKFDELVRKYRHQTQYSKRHVLAMMWPNAWRDGLVTVTFYLTGQATVLMSSNFLTLYETGIYSFSMQVINTLLGIANGMFGAYFPAIQSAYVSKNRKLMRQLYAKAMACTLHLSFLGIIAFLLIGIPIIQFIRNDFIIERSSFCVLAFAMYLLSRHRNSAAFISTMNKLPFTFSFIFFGIISISATYIGLAYFHLGLWGLILIPLAVQSIYNNWKWNQVVNRYLHTTEIKLMRQGTAELMRMVGEKIFR
ncbi:O-unit flippase-like protein [uncultured Megasphaera sp.]|uniref:O-unit flippase-like protein n=1 Tax=uncultured Megasphaera sp. TaxID=165188 RepID=UPI0025F69764|nr:O-unit flippase-like protein [uncultured Megasphaera sp.]